VATQDLDGEFSTQLRLLLTTSGLSYNQLINAAARHPTPIKLTASSLSAWSNGTSVPADPRKLRYLVEFLEARVRSDLGYRPLGVAVWEGMRRRAWDQRHAKPGGRPLRVRGATPAGGRPAHSQTPRIDIRLEAAQIESVSDPGAHYASWAKDRRVDLLKDCDPEPTFADNDVANLYRRVNVGMINVFAVPDTRTVADYTAEVDAYLAKAVTALVAQALRGQSRHGPAMLKIALINNTDVYITDIQLDISIPGVAAYLDQPSEAAYRNISTMPLPPKPFRTLTSNFFADSAPLARIGIIRDHGAVPLLGPSRPPRRSWTVRHTDTGTGSDIRYTGLNLRAGDTVSLEPVPIRIPSGVTRVTATWVATGTNVNGRQEGEFTVDVTGSTYEMPPAPTRTTTRRLDDDRLQRRHRAVGPEST
jgi:hypothetical protein